MLYTAALRGLDAFADFDALKKIQTTPVIINDKMTRLLVKSKNWSKRKFAKIPWIRLTNAIFIAT